MNDHVTISTFQLFKLFPNEEAARLYLESRLWPDGVYHQVSKKHLGRYVDEFTFRLNDGDVKRQTLHRLDSLIRATWGKRLTYEGLTQ